MRRLGLMLALISTVAIAGEAWLGTLTPRGGLSTNSKGGTADAGFRIGPSQKITVQCINADGGSASTYVCVNNVSTCTAALGLLLTGNQALPTSTPPNQVALTDGGTSCVVSAISNNALDSCNVFTRSGNEF